MSQNVYKIHILDTKMNHIPGKSHLYIQLQREERLKSGRLPGALLVQGRTHLTTEYSGERRLGEMGLEKTNRG